MTYRLFLAIISLSQTLIATRDSGPHCNPDTERSRDPRGWELATRFCLCLIAISVALVVPFEARAQQTVWAPGINSYYEMPLMETRVCFMRGLEMSHGYFVRIQPLDRIFPLKFGG